MPVKITLTMEDGSVHDFLSMEDAIAHVSAPVAAPVEEPMTVEPAPVEEAPVEEAPVEDLSA